MIRSSRFRPISAGSARLPRPNRLLLRECQVQPLFLVFEDLHWIDAETQAFLDDLINSVPTAAMVLAVNYRPEYRHGWGGKTCAGGGRRGTLARLDR